MACKRGKTAGETMTSSLQFHQAHYLPMSDDDATFWEQHKFWVTDVLTETMEPQVSDPENTRTFLGSFTTYRVVVGSRGWNVRRRFSDFHALREFLCIRYVGMLIPALPEKRTLSKTDPNVVRDRVRGLGLFLDRALANPYLRCDADVIHFLSAVEPKDYDKLKESEKTATGDSDNIGLNRWRQAIARYKLPTDADAVVAGVRQKLEAMEGCYRDISQSAKRLAEKSAAFSGEMATFQAAFTAMKGVRVTGISITSETDLETVSDTLGMGISAWAKMLEFQPRMLDALLYSTFKFETFQISNMREMLKQRDEMTAAKVKAEKQLERHNAEMEAVSRTGRDDRVAKIAKQVEDDKAIAQRASYVEEVFTKALLFSEIDRLSEEKAALLRDIFSQYSVSGARLCQREAALWQTMSSQMGIDPGRAAARAKRSMDAYATTSTDAVSSPSKDGVSGGGSGGGGV